MLPSSFNARNSALHRMFCFGRDPNSCTRPFADLDSARQQGGRALNRCNLLGMHRLRMADDRLAISPTPPGTTT